jgi:predicted ATPase with chaperone activity
VGGARGRSPASVTRRARTGEGGEAESTTADARTRLGDPRRACRCSPVAVETYLWRLTGPLLDRIDLHVEVPAVPFAELTAKADGTPSAAVREQVVAARARQRARLGDDGVALIR